VSQQQDKSFMITFVGVIGVLVVVTILLILLSVFAGGPQFLSDERRQLEYERAEARLLPAGAVRLTGDPMPEVAQAQPTPAATEALAPAEVYKSFCSSCHAAGIVNAPRSGNEADWAPRLKEKGFAALVKNSITGIGGMPPRGGNPRLSDEELEETVRYMLEQAGLDAD
jgi:cytochrome c5